MTDVTVVALLQHNAWLGLQYVLVLGLTLVAMRVGWRLLVRSLKYNPGPVVHWDDDPDDDWALWADELDGPWPVDSDGYWSVDLDGY